MKCLEKYPDFSLLLILQSPTNNSNWPKFTRSSVDRRAWEMYFAEISHFLMEQSRIKALNGYENDWHNFINDNFLLTADIRYKRTLLK